MALGERWWEPLFDAAARAPRDDEAWSALYLGLWPYLADWVVSRYHLDGDAARDVLQDAMLQYRDKLRAGAIEQPSLAHLRGFIRYGVLTALRARARFVPLDDLIELPDGQRDALDTRLLVDAVLERMDGPCAFLLREKYIAGRSSQELARALGSTDGSIRVQLHRCRERFRALLGEATQG